METKFNHSIRVPTQYRAAANTLRKTLEEGESVQNQIFNAKHVRTQRLYALMVKISKHKQVLERLIESSGILVENPRLDRYMCLVLMTELLFGVGKLNGESKPVECVRSFKEKFDAILNEKDSDLLANDTDGVLVKELAPKPRYVRINLNSMSRAEAIETFEKDGWHDVTNDIDSYDKYLEAVSQLGDHDYVSDIHVQNLFVFPASSKKFWARNPLVTEGKVVLQDKASCLPAVLLAPPKGSIVLDMCAAPGMKTTHLASIMKNRGTVYAVEQNPERCSVLKKLVRSTASSIVHTINQDSLSLSAEQVPNVQYILVDPSCSGSGMVNRLFKTEHTPADRLYRLAGLQIKLLAYAMKTFPRAERIVYSTCSLYAEENEEVVQRCLEWYPHWELIKPIEFAEKWKSFGSPKYKHIGKKCLYARPEVDMTNGFFVALFQRREDVEFVPRPVKSRSYQTPIDIDTSSKDDHYLLDEQMDNESETNRYTMEGDLAEAMENEEIDGQTPIDIDRLSTDDVLFDEQHSEKESKTASNTMETYLPIDYGNKEIDGATDIKQEKGKQKKKKHKCVDENEIAVRQKSKKEADEGIMKKDVQTPIDIGKSSTDDVLVDEYSKKSSKKRDKINVDLATEYGNEEIEGATDRRQEKEKKKKRLKHNSKKTETDDDVEFVSEQVLTKNGQTSTDIARLSTDDVLFDEHSERASKKKRKKMDADRVADNDSQEMDGSKSHRDKEKEKKKKKKRNSVPENYDEVEHMSKKTKTNEDVEFVPRQEVQTPIDIDQSSTVDVLFVEHREVASKKKRNKFVANLVVNGEEEIGGATDKQKKRKKKHEKYDEVEHLPKERETDDDDYLPTI